MQLRIRSATSADIDSLVRIETRVFATDRIARRSFRQLIARSTARTVVAECNGAVCGYAMVLFRAGAAVARLYSIAVDPQASGRGIGRLLLEAAEAAAFQAARLVLRLEVREDNAQAIALYRSAGFRPIGRVPDYYQDHAAALRFEKLLRSAAPHATAVPYWEQSEDFTCGPACLMMALGRFDPSFRPDPVTEIRLWREATTVLMLSGPGGCEPWGLAVTAHAWGLSAAIIVSSDGPLFLASVRSEEKRRVMQHAQTDFRARARSAGIPVDYRSFTLEDVQQALQCGALVAVLISGYLMFGKKVPHWVLVIGADSDHVFIHDPWVEDERGETAADAANIPVPFGAFMTMARFGRDHLRAAVILAGGKS